jgi:hypothetical protein
MSLGLDVFFHQSWTENRLVWPKGRSPDKPIRLGAKAKDILWIPDVYFKNAKSGELMNIIQDTLYFMVTKDRIFMAARLYLDLNCNMNFEDYPFDSQKCKLEIMSLSNTVDLVELKWDAFRTTDNMYLSDYYVTGVTKSSEVKSYKGIGKFSLLKATLTMKRSVGKYVTKRYMPTFLVVILTFVGFWLPTNDVSARVGLVITALLALIADQFQAEDLNVSYVYALAVWSLSCIVFVFATLIEFAIALAWTKYQVEEIGNGTGNGTGNGLQAKGQPKPRSYYTHKYVAYFCCAFTCDNPIDLYARIFFPLAYFLFIFIYCAVYCF